ncbi:MAG: hypothetical protein Q7S29_00270 [Candidatus Peribacter sp.]|nr:hypothetical protein [Candidatus Peribacter sp.]
MSTVEALPGSSTAEREFSTPETWPEGVPRNGMELSQELDLIRGPNFERRMELMQKDGPEFAEIQQIESRLASLTYSARPFTDLRVAKGIAEDLQRLRDLYGMGNRVGRTLRGFKRKVGGWIARTPAMQRDAL